MEKKNLIVAEGHGWSEAALDIPNEFIRMFLHELIPILKEKGREHAKKGKKRQMEWSRGV